MRWQPLLLALAVSLVGRAAPARRATLPPCDGRYLVRGDQLIAAGVATDSGEVTVRGQAVSIGTSCPALAGTVRTTPKGTRIRDRWQRCGGLRKARLKALVSVDCKTMHGRFAAKQTPPRVFEAVHSVCGDGIVDRAGTEQCEADADCQPGGRCDGCGCVGPDAATSTTTSTSTTSTLPCRANGAACTQDDQCCSDACDLGFCVCLGLGDGCNGANQCCSNYCQGQSLTCDCLLAGNPCLGGPRSCCGGNPCVNGACCVPSGGACAIDDECCAGMCMSNQRCACIANKGGCVDDAQCCSRRCTNGTCCGQRSFSCTSPSECCSGYCDPDPVIQGLFICG